MTSKSIVAGAAGGLAGAFVMNQFQSFVSSVSEEVARREARPQPPKPGPDESATVKTAKAISERVFHHELSDDEKKWAGPAVHYGFGAALGALYGGLAEASPVFAKGLGTAYGTAVWFGADEVAVPAAGLSGPPTRYPVGVHTQALVSHWIFALAADLTRRAILRIV